MDIANAEKQQPLFEQVINRLDSISKGQRTLASRAYEKSQRITGIEHPFKSEKLQSDSDPDSIIYRLNSIMDELEINNQILNAVVSDLEKAID